MSDSLLLEVRIGRMMRTRLCLEAYHNFIQRARIQRRDWHYIVSAFISIQRQKVLQGAGAPNTSTLADVDIISISDHVWDSGEQSQEE